jgi:hypothetical protein
MEVCLIIFCVIEIRYNTHISIQYNASKVSPDGIMPYKKLKGKIVPGLNVLNTTP